MSEKSGTRPAPLEPLHIRSRTADGTDRQNLQDTLVAGVADERGIVPPVPQDTAVEGSPYAAPPRAAPKVQAPPPAAATWPKVALGVALGLVLAALVLGIALS
jgi:hypothetical protein